ncbi:unnamed protein product [Amoebophrya sp. A25]|nr:unnamed protein product [Amoebophrya sp. A25]|eukprot:GSA25T00020286001.1
MPLHCFICRFDQHKKCRVFPVLVKHGRFCLRKSWCQSCLDVAWRIACERILARAFDRIRWWPLFRRETVKASL